MWWYFVYEFSQKKGLDKEINEFKEQLKDLYIQEEENSKKIEQIDSHQRHILSKYNCSSKSQLKRLRDNIYFKEMNQTNRLEKKLID